MHHFILVIAEVGMQRGSFVVFLCFLLCVAGQSFPENCTYTDPGTGEFYDLRGLSIPVNASLGSFYFYDTIDDGSETDYYVNICAPVNPVAGCSGNTTVCQVTNQNSSISCGLLTDGAFNPYPVTGGRNSLLIGNFE